MKKVEERLQALENRPDLGAWFDALVSVMSDGNPPVRRFNGGDAVMRAGELAESFLVILEGQANVEQVFADSPDLAVGPSAVLGELGVLFEGRRRRNVVARSPVVAIEGTREELQRALEIESVGAHVANVAARRLAENVDPVIATTSSGIRVLLRPLLPTDRNLYLTALGNLSLETLRKRFFIARTPPDVVIKRLMDIDYIDHVAWVAGIYQPGGGPAGVCRLIVSMEDAGTAEIAIGVVDEHQGQGIGTILLGALGVLAQARGLRFITGYVQADNEAMRALCNKADASWSQNEPEVLAVRMPVASVAKLLDPGTAQGIAFAARKLSQVACLADA